MFQEMQEKVQKISKHIYDLLFCVKLNSGLLVIRKKLIFKAEDGLCLHTCRKIRHKLSCKNFKIIAQCIFDLFLHFDVRLVPRFYVIRKKMIFIFTLYVFYDNYVKGSLFTTVLWQNFQQKKIPKIFKTYLHLILLFYVRFISIFFVVRKKLIFISLLIIFAEKRRSKFYVYDQIVAKVVRKISKKSVPFLYPCSSFWGKTCNKILCSWGEINIYI